MTAAVVGPAAHGGVARHVAEYCSGMEKETAGRHVPPSADGDVDITVDPKHLAATPADPDSRPATADRNRLTETTSAVRRAAMQ